MLGTRTAAFPEFNPLLIVYHRCPICAESFLVEFLLDRHLEMAHPCPTDALPVTKLASLPAITLIQLPPPMQAPEMAGLMTSSPSKSLDLRQIFANSTSSNLEECSAVVKELGEFL